ncbi:MAG: hypothetical protein QOI72_586 [Solirubrobacterales bacterium]|nr:hypothetical protein [Solirubrobacterales bacterium]
MTLGGARPESAVPPELPQKRDVGDLQEATWQRTCFFSAPIGEPGTKQRRHSDVFLDSLVRPAIEALDPGMRVIRADQLPSSLVTASVFECVLKSRLVIADLSFHNANVLHEVGMRHLSAKPFVLISRTDEEIPANLKEIRVVRINTSEVFEFTQEIEDRRSEIASYAGWALSPAAENASPVERFSPDYRNPLGSPAA